MTCLLLVRHAAHDNVGGFLAGRLDGVGLGADGRAQAARLGERLRCEEIGAVHASPRARTQETAAAIAAPHGLTVQTTPLLDEIDFGLWSGRGFDDLDGDWEWRRWNTVRSIAQTPAGEAVLDVQARVVRLIRTVHAQKPQAAVVLVTHADVIKAAVCFYLGLGLDAWPRLEVDPASITTLHLEDWAVRLYRLNEAGG